MKHLRNLKLFTLLGFTMLITACSTIPAELQTTNEDNLVGFNAAVANPTTVEGRSARWGGVIAGVKNQDNKTIVEVVNFDLRTWGRPEISSDSNGRFRAVIDGFVDPVVYEKGRSVTFVGTISGAEEGKIDEHTYIFPTLAVSGRKLWEEERKTSTQIDYSPLWYRHQFYSPYYYSPYRYYYPRVPIRTHDTIQQRSSGSGATSQRQ